MTLEGFALGMVFAVGAVLVVRAWMTRGEK